MTGTGKVFKGSEFIADVQYNYHVVQHFDEGHTLNGPPYRVPTGASIHLRISPPLAVSGDLLTLHMSDGKKQNFYVESGGRNLSGNGSALLALGLFPAGFSGFSGDLAALFLRHGLETAFPADLTALAPDGRHVFGNALGWSASGRLGNFRLWCWNLARRNGNGPCGQLIRITRTFAFADHCNPMMPQRGC
jgi:hypothetical protein